MINLEQLVGKRIYICNSDGEDIRQVKVIAVVETVIHKDKNILFPSYKLARHCSEIIYKEAQMHHNFSIYIDSDVDLGSRAAFTLEEIRQKAETFKIRKLPIVKG